MSSRSPNRTLKNKHKNQEGLEKVEHSPVWLFSAESRTFVCYHNTELVPVYPLNSHSLSKENVKFQRTVESAGFTPSWAGCHVKQWRGVCGKTGQKCTLKMKTSTPTFTRDGHLEQASLALAHIFFLSQIMCNTINKNTD